jgi:hypothetical protein
MLQSNYRDDHGDALMPYMTALIDVPLQEWSTLAVTQFAASPLWPSLMRRPLIHLRWSPGWRLSQLVFLCPSASERYGDTRFVISVIQVCFVMYSYSASSISGFP